MNETCVQNRKKVEFLVKHWTSKNPNCPTCGVEVSRNPAAPAAVWLKGIGQYCGENKEGHWATARDEKGQVVREFITTHQQQDAWCKRWNYYSPDELPSSVPNDENGDKNTYGSPGAWI